MWKNLRWPWIFTAGLLLILAYGFWNHPPGFARGYTEDLAFSELTRQMVGDSIREVGHPVFVTNRFMAPEGISMPFMSWSIERDWLGGLFWNWNKDFPFLWAYAVFSLVISYLGVGFILGGFGGGMGFNRSTAWLIALISVLFHVPRHMKTWYHYEHLLQHWVYWGIFLDAWLWQKFSRERVWSLKLEVWRAVTMVGVLGTSGYFWGPMMLSWLCVHGFMLAQWRGVRIEKTRVPQLVLPVALGLGYSALVLAWFLPIAAEVKKLGPVFQGVAWFGHLGFLVRPLWFEWTYGLLPLPQPSPIYTSETVVTVGWFYWIPALIAVAILRKKKGGTGERIIAPFLTLLIIAILYACFRKPAIIQKVIQAVIPLMNYFRVASRWGLVLPQILTVITVLAWPELSRWCASRPKRWGEKKATVALAAFLAFSAVEARWIFYPVFTLPPLPNNVVQMMDSIRKAPGTTVLDLPFCVAGGNGICTTEQCPNYPFSTIGSGLRQWHEKKVYGLYQARMVAQHCQIYNKPPYTSWFDAWGRQRCFTPDEWGQFCQYLDQHQELSAILLYPQIWVGAGRPECMAEFGRHLGSPLGTGQLKLTGTRGGAGENDTTVMWFGARCLTK